jgi:hypothetical protein
VGVGYPAAVDEGVVEVVKEKKPLISLFGGKAKSAFGGPLSVEGT